MEEKFTYYLYLDSQWKKKELIDNNLELKFVVEGENKGFGRKILDGSFMLSKDDFDELINAFGSSVEFRIYENGDILTGTLVYEGYINQFNDYDYNSKLLKIKDFTTKDLYSDFFDIMNRENERFVNQGTAQDIYSASAELITSQSYDFDDILNSFFIGEVFDFIAASAWYDTANIDFTKLRMANFAQLTNFNGNVSLKKITLKRILEIIRIMFRGYWYLDSDDIKFKRPQDLVTNPLDLSSLLIHKKQKFFNYGSRFAIETLKFNKNNPASVSGYEPELCNIDYAWTADQSKIHDLEDISTYFNPVEFSYDTNGWYMAMVESDDYLEMFDLIGTSTSKENGRLMPANLIGYFYREMIYTNRANYTYFGIQETTTPTYFNDFIDLPEVQTILDNVVFYDGLVYEKDESNNEMIGRTIEQSTNLRTNITTFKCVEFTNAIN